MSFTLKAAGQQSPDFFHLRHTCSKKYSVSTFYFMVLNGFVRLDIPLSGPPDQAFLGRICVVHCSRTLWYTDGCSDDLGILARKHPTVATCHHDLEEDGG